MRSCQLPPSLVPVTASEAAETQHMHHCGYTQRLSQTAIHQITDRSGKRGWTKVQSYTE